MGTETERRRRMVKSRGGIGLEIDREKFVLEQICFQRFRFYRDRADFLTDWVEEFGNGFGRIVSPIEMDCKRLLLGFRELSYAKKRRGVNVYSAESKFKFFNSSEIDEAAAEEIMRIAEGEMGMIRLRFSTRISDRNATNEIGFKLVGPERKAVSVYCCIPGHLRDEDFVWRGEDKEFDSVYGVLERD